MPVTIDARDNPLYEDQEACMFCGGLTVQWWGGGCAPVCSRCAQTHTDSEAYARAKANGLGPLPKQPVEQLTHSTPGGAAVKYLPEIEGKHEEKRAELNVTVTVANMYVCPGCGSVLVAGAGLSLKYEVTCPLCDSAVDMTPVSQTGVRL